MCLGGRSAADRAGADAARQLAVLAEAGLVFSGELAARLAFERVLDILRLRHGAIRAAVALLDPRSQEIRIEASAGLTDAEFELKSDYIDSMSEWSDPLYQKITDKLPSGTKPSDFVTSLNVSARKEIMP